MKDKQCVYVTVSKKCERERKCTLSVDPRQQQLVFPRYFFGKSEWAFISPSQGINQTPRSTFVYSATYSRARGRRDKVAGAMTISVVRAKIQTRLLLKNCLWEFDEIRRRLYLTLNRREDERCRTHAVSQWCEAAGFDNPFQPCSIIFCRSVCG